MIKLVIALFFIFGCSFISNAQETKSANRFTFSGTINELNTKLLCLAYKDQTGRWIKDTCVIKNNSFEFVGYINGPTYATLSGHTKTNSSDDPNFTTIFLEPGNIEATLIENDFKNSKIIGSQTQYDANILRERKKNIIEKEDKLSNSLNEFNKIIQNGDTSSGTRYKREAMWNEYAGCREQDKQIDYTFIASHPDSYLSPYLMKYYFGTRKLSLDSAELFFKRFHDSVQNGSFGKEIREQIKARKLSATGSKAPIFSKIDINENEINLKAFEGKNYVLLDFWASWCVPCRKITPRLRNLYEKYHQKGLDIISISWDSNKKAWVDAISKDDTNNWINIFANVYLPSDNGLREKYAIASIPTFILIDKHGTIIGRYCGDGEDGDETALFNKLNKIFDVN